MRRRPSTASKFRAVRSVSNVQKRAAVERYLESLENADREDEPTLENSAVPAALENLRCHAEPEAGFMKTAQGMLPAYNVFFVSSESERKGFNRQIR